MKLNQVYKVYTQKLRCTTEDRIENVFLLRQTQIRKTNIKKRFFEATNPTLYTSSQAAQ